MLKYSLREYSINHTAQTSTAKPGMIQGRDFEEKWSEEVGSQHALTRSLQFMCLWNWLLQLDLLILTLTQIHAVTSIRCISAHFYKAPDVSFLQTLLSPMWTSKRSPRTGPISMEDMVLGSVVGNSCFASMGSLPLNYSISCQSWQLPWDCSPVLACRSEVAGSGLPAPHVPDLVGRGPTCTHCSWKGLLCITPNPHLQEPQQVRHIHLPKCLVWAASLY